jgi:hypothetical protein
MSVVWEHRLIWQDYTIEIMHTSNWCARIGLDHLSIMCLSPERAALPFTETANRSAFLQGELIIRACGAIAYVKAWPDEASQSPEWKAQAEAARQESLF